MRIRAIWCTIWILGALVVIAMLDNRRDPPATNPDGAQCNLSKALSLEKFPLDKASPFCEALATTFPFPIHFIAADARLSDYPSTRMVLAEQAADPSPPGPLCRRRPNLLS